MRSDVWNQLVRNGPGQRRFIRRARCPAVEQWLEVKEEEEVEEVEEVEEEEATCVNSGASCLLLVT